MRCRRAPSGLRLSPGITHFPVRIWQSKQVQGGDQTRLYCKYNTASIEETHVASPAAAARPGARRRARRSGPAPRRGQIGRASCRESVGKYVKMMVVAGSLKKKQNKTQNK